ncbi:MAG: PEGA domain-containing protein [Deltaproteobacteria bacterium]|nr:PEGA domain-containing protein [Deltaproteobacteria bacterium]
MYFTKFLCKTPLFLVFAAFVLSTFIPAKVEAKKAPWKRRGRRVKVKFYSTPSGATVYIEDKKWGAAATTTTRWMRLPRNQSYKIILEKDGMQPLVKTIKLGRSYRNRFRFTMKKKIYPGYIEIKDGGTNSATGADIFIDGKKMGEVPAKIELKPGKYSIKIQKKGYMDVTDIKDVSQKSTISMLLNMVKLEKPKGTLLVTSDVNNAEVFVDKKNVGFVPKMLKLEPGNHLVVVKYKNKQIQKVVTIQSGQTSKINLKLKEEQEDVPQGMLTVIANTENAKVYVDGIMVGKAPVHRKKFIEGQHLIKVEANGYISEKRTVELVKNKQKLESFELKEKPKIVPIGSVKITTENGASIFVDGNLQGQSAYKNEKMKAGTYHLEIQKKGFKTVKKTINVKKDKQINMHVPLKRVGAIKVIGNIKGANIIIDNSPIGKIPLLKYELPVGTYRLEVEASGYREYTRSIEIKGNTTEPKTINVNLLPLGPTPQDIERMKTSLSAYGVKTIPPRSFTASAGIDWPYILDGKLMVGIWRKGDLGIDGGATFRTYFNMTEFIFNLRGQLFQGGPLTAGVFMDIGGGVGRQERTNFTFNLGGGGTLSFREKVNLTVKTYFNVYRDRFCLGAPPEADDPRTEPGFCESADPAEQVKGWQDHSLRDPYWGIRIMFEASVEWALNSKWSVYSRLRWAPIGLKPSDTNLRPAFMEFYGTSWMPATDPAFYGGVGFLWKF